MGMTARLGNLRNGSNDGLANLNCRNDLSRASWYYGSRNIAQNLIQQRRRYNRYINNVSWLSCTLKTSVSAVCRSSAECAKWLEVQDRLVNLRKVKSWYTATIEMKRKCKHVDISDHDLIEKAVYDCVNHKGLKIFDRADFRELFTKCNNSIDEIITLLQSEIKAHKIVLKPIKYEDRVDKSNGKIRRIAIEDIKQQFYDYIAYNALEELAPYIGHYQIACKHKMGPLFGAKVIQVWINEKGVRYGIKADIKKCYPSIKHSAIMAWLKKHVNNDELLWLIDTLLNTVEEGLPIGSYLSIRLSALYLADIYHHIEDSYYSVRRGKRNNIFLHQMFNVDDFYLFGSNASAMNRAMKDIIKYAADRGLTIKPEYQLINLNHNDPHAHIDVLGYRVYRDHITMRHRNYVKLKKSLNDFEMHPTLRNARSLCARGGMHIKHTNSLRFCRKYNVYKHIRQARKVISNYDKGKIQRKAAICPRYTC